MIAKGRAKFDVSAPPFRGKLRGDQVREIREAYAAGGVSYRDLAARYGIHSSNVSRLVNGQSYGVAQGRT
jgi:ribosome-binding protein aMBF1 (putative translation factor)